jgi:hypothetical protein
MEQVFTAPTLEEANRKADDWWMKQKDVRQIRRAQTSGGWGAPPAVRVTEWTVKRWPPTLDPRMGSPSRLLKKVGRGLAG